MMSQENVKADAAIGPVHTLPHEELLAAAQRGNANAQLEMGSRHRYGHKVTTGIDLAQAAYWYLQAARTTKVDHQKAFGLSQVVALVEQDLKADFISPDELFSGLLALSQGSEKKWAAEGLGDCFRLGIGTPVDGAAALQCYELGDGIRSQALYATLLDEMAIVPCDKKKAFDLALRYIQCGEVSGPAMILGRAYEEGILVAPDKRTAVNYYLIAMRRGNQSAAARLWDLGLLDMLDIFAWYCINSDNDLFADAPRCAEGGKLEAALAWRGDAVSLDAINARRRTELKYSFKRYGHGLRPYFCMPDVIVDSAREALYERLGEFLTRAEGISALMKHQVTPARPNKSMGHNARTKLAAERKMAAQACHWFHPALGNAVAPLLEDPDKWRSEPEGGSYNSGEYRSAISGDVGYASVFLRGTYEDFIILVHELGHLHAYDVSGQPAHPNFSEVQAIFLEIIACDWSISRGTAPGVIHGAGAAWQCLQRMLFAVTGAERLAMDENGMVGETRMEKELTALSGPDWRKAPHLQELATTLADWKNTPYQRDAYKYYIHKHPTAAVVAAGLYSMVQTDTDAKAKMIDILFHVDGLTDTLAVLDRLGITAQAQLDDMTRRGAAVLLDMMSAAK